MLRRVTSAFIAILGFVTIGNSGSAQDQDNAATVGIEVQKYGAVIRELVWDKSQFPVHICFVNATPADEPDEDIVMHAVEATWEKAAAVKFDGFRSCDGIVNPVRIELVDAVPDAFVIGRNLANYPAGGFTLNFTFKNWNHQCADLNNRNDCIRIIAVHEFGHVLGMTHEQNRSDSKCKGHHQGKDPDKYVTIYDSKSVMNWCNPDWDGNGQLSQFDIDTVQFLYGKPS